MALENSNHQFLLEYPVLTSLSLIHSYPSRPLIDILEKPRSPIVDKSLSRETWIRHIDTLYLPLYTFLLNHEIRIATIITGHFIDFVAQEHPVFYQVLQDMIQKQLLYCVMDAYWGTSHLSLYYLDWWKDEIEGTQKSLKKHLGVESTAVYIPLVFRALPLERLTQGTSVRRFISTKKQKRAICYETNLREFRRFHKGKVTWIEEEDNVGIEILYYPQRLLFHMMNTKVSKNPEALVKTISMEIGLKSSRVATDIRTPSIQRSAVRIPEERPVQYYNDLQQAVVRLWEYATFILGKEHAEDEHIDDDPLMRNLFYVMHRDFLYYLDPAHYSKKRNMPFSSPYEAFVHVQNVVFQLETLLNKK